MQPVKLGAGVCFSLSAALLATLSLLSPSCAQTVEPAQQLSDRLKALSTERPASPPHDYVIGGGDLLSIQVFDVQELSREVRVSQTGTIGIPLVPVRLHVSGLTETQAEVKIAEVLEANGLVSHPEVSVTVKERKSKPITVVGAVAHPMVYQADRDVTLVEVLAEAGGLTNDAADSVIITRPVPDQSAELEPPVIPPDDPALGSGHESAAISPNSPAMQEPGAPSSSSSSATAGSSDSAPIFPSPSARKTQATAVQNPPPIPPQLTNTITVNLNQILEAGDTSNNIVLQPGDVVTVPHAGIVYALGAVSRPGGFLVSNDRSQLTTLKLLSLAGGLDRSAKLHHAVIVRKDANGQQREVEVDLKKVLKFEAEDIRLQPSDILYVPKSSAKQALFRVGELSLAIGSGLAIYRLIP